MQPRFNKRGCIVPAGLCRVARGFFLWPRGGFSTGLFPEVPVLPFLVFDFFLEEIRDLWQHTISEPSLGVARVKTRTPSGESGLAC